MIRALAVAAPPMSARSECREGTASDCRIIESSAVDHLERIAAEQGLAAVDLAEVWFVV